MTTEEIIALAKEKLGKEITEQEAKDYMNGKIPLPDEALELVSGGASCGTEKCPSCGTAMVKKDKGVFYCNKCSLHYNKRNKDWEVFDKCPLCGNLSFYRVVVGMPSIYECRICGYSNRVLWTRRW